MMRLLSRICFAASIACSVVFSLSVRADTSAIEDASLRGGLWGFIEQYLITLHLLNIKK